MTDSTAAGLPITQGKLPALAFPALLGANMALALGPWLVRIADTGPVATGFWRLALALPVLLLLAARSGGGVFRPSRKALLIVLASGLFFAADLASWHLGIVRTKLANAALFGNSSSLMLPFAAILVTGIHPTRIQWIALCVAILGAMLLMGGSYELSSANLAGDLLCLFAGVLYVGYLLLIQTVRRDMASWPVLAWSTLASAPCVLVFALMAGERIMPGNWGPVLGLALLCQIGGQGLMVYAIVHFSPLVVGLALLTQPALAALIGWLAFDERLTATDLIGAAIIAVALIVARLPARTPQRPRDALDRDS